MPADPRRFWLHRSVGEVLTQFEVDVERAEFTPRGSLTLPGDMQYLWPHPSRRFSTSPPATAA